MSIVDKRQLLMFFCAKLLFYRTQLRFAQLFNKAYDDDDEGWIRMKLGMQIGLGPGHIVLHGDRAP